MTRKNLKSKKEILTEQIAAAVGAGREVAVETVDFSDPNRGKTCLEVDFPIIPINQIAAIEGNSASLFIKCLSGGRGGVPASSAPCFSRRR